MKGRFATEPSLSVQRYKDLKVGQTSVCGSVRLNRSPLACFGLDPGLYSMERFGVGESFGKRFVIGRHSGAPPSNVTIRFTEKPGERYTLIRCYKPK